MKVTIFKNIYDTDVPYIVPIDKVIDRIKNGKSKDTIDKLQSATEDEAKKKIKNSLPCILFSGEFKERNKESLIKHSGLMVIDFDNIPKSKLKSHQKIINKNKHVYLSFVSPSGNGLKAVVKIPETDIDNHSKYYKEFKDTFDYAYLDISGSDVARACFESYDKNIYVNDKAEVFDPELKDVGFEVHKRTPLIPLNDEYKIMERIMKWNWTKDFVSGQRNTYVFELSGAFCEYGVNKSTAIDFIDNNIRYGDFTTEETKRTIESAYKLRNFNVKYFEDYQKLNSIKKDFSKGKDAVIKKHNISEETFEEIKEVNEHDDFWYFEDTKKGVSVKVDILKYKHFLERNGFKKYYQSDDSSPIFVKIESNIVKEITTDRIKDYVLNYLTDRNELNVWRYCAGYQNLFASTFLNFLQSVNLEILKDKKNTSFIYYKNGILKITKDKIELIDYIDIDSYVWESQIIQRNFKYKTSYKNDYQGFIHNVSNGSSESFESVIGYLVSTYKDKTNNKAIILNDEVISENPEGGTGKGLFSQGINQVRNMSILDGKTFDEKKSFPYQTVSPDTNVLYFDDVGKAFDFESKFSLITEGITLERKNQNALKLSVEESPKILISTNYAIKGSGNSHERRRFEIEFAQHYNRNRTPFDDFKRHLFDDWSAEDYNNFDNYIARCVQLYINKGLIIQDAINIKLRKFIAETSMEFWEFVNDEENIVTGLRVYKDDIHSKFINTYSDYKKLTKKRITSWFKNYADYLELQFIQDSDMNGRYFEIVKGMATNPLDNEDKPPF